MKGFGGSNGDMTVNARIWATCFQSFLKKEKKTNQKQKPLKREWENPLSKIHFIL